MENMYFKVLEFYVQKKGTNPAVLYFLYFKVK